tara:strand:- start:566 stop:1072 length:507 start_codon:yes stop_codon:yes gene_type:complete
MKKPINIRIFSKEGFELIDIANALYDQGTIDDLAYKDFVCELLNTFHNNFAKPEDKECLSKVSKLIDQSDETVIDDFRCQGSIFDKEYEPNVCEIRSNFMSVETLLRKKEMLEGDVNLLLEQIEDYKKQKEQALEEFAEIKVKNKLFTNTLKSKLDSIDRIDGDLLEE